MTTALRLLADMVTQRTGIVTEGRRLETLGARLEPMMRKRGFASFDDLLAALKSGSEPGLPAALIDAATINETLFFRDRHPFENFRTLMLDRLLLARAETRRLRIWSAACSTGQEPYSLAILLDEHARRLAGWSVELIATDISRQSLAIARAGVYSHFEAQRGLSTPHLLRHFSRQGTQWAVSDPIRAAVTFAERNLLGDFRDLGIFDVIFCRNVLMYMDTACRSRVLDRLARALAPDGYLVLGAAETVVGVTDVFMPLAGHPSIYVPRGESGRPPLKIVAERRSAG
jgi:chemotaxis protein methyltransferase CheR